MASPSDGRYIMGYPTPKPNHQVPPPGYAVPYQAGAYPPPPPLPPTQPGYPGYVPPTGPKPYASPSFNLWFNPRNYGPTGWAPPDEDRGKRFGRLLLVTMVTLIISMCMLSLVIWLLFGMEIPEFRVSTLTVSNLNANDSVVAASWEANVTVYNPNPDIKIDFDPIRASIFYKNYPLGMSPLEPVYLQGTRLYELGINMDNQTAVPKPPLSEEINDDQKKGVMFVSLRMSLGTKFTSNSIWRKETLRVFCEDLKVNLSPQGGTSGTLADDAQTDCLIFT